MEIGATKAVQDRLKTTKIEESKGASLVFCWDTHLTKIKGDVYKRQDLDEILQWAENNYIDVYMPIISRKEYKMMDRALRSVSYTHLDVYKRQILKR